MQLHYVALVHGKPGKYGISFPDFAGCVSAGTSVDDVIRLGTEALHFHLEGMVGDDAPIPAPRSVKQIRADPDLKRGLRDAIVTLVPVVTPAGKPAHSNVSLDEGLVVEIDKAAAQAGQTRSGFLADAARRSLGVAVNRRVVELAEKACTVTAPAAGKAKKPAHG